MSAFFGEDLILDLDACRTGALKHFDRAMHIHRIAKTRIGIHQQRQSNGIADGSGRIGNFGQGRQTDIGRA